MDIRNARLLLSGGFGFARVGASFVFVVIVVVVVVVFLFAFIIRELSSSVREQAPAAAFLASLSAKILLLPERCGCQKIAVIATNLLGLASRVGVRAEVGGSGAGLGEVTREDGVEERAEDDLGTAGLGKGHPEDKDELEGVVEWEPIDGAHGALEDSQESIDHPVRQPLSIIDLARAEQRSQRVVAGDDEARDVNEELSGDVEEDEEEVEGSETEDSIDLGHGSLLLKVVEGGVLGKLFVELGDVVLGTVLDRHGGGVDVVSR